MKRVLLLLAEGFEFFEASVFIDVIGWNQLEGDGSTQLFTCGFTKEVKSSFKHKLVVDYLIEDINVNEFDALAVPGGFEEFGFYNQAYDEKFLSLIRAFDEQKKVIASICVAALPLAKSGVIKGKKGTTYRTRHAQLSDLGVEVLNDPIVVENKIITSWNPSTAVDVAMLLLEMLTNTENTIKVRELMGFDNK